MSRFLRAILTVALACSIAATRAEAQVAAKKAQAADPAASTRQALSLAESGRCAEALPVLKRNTQGLPDKQLRYLAAFATVNCGMSVNDTAAVMNALALLRRDFPDDPEVLYSAARIFSQLAESTAKELAERFPKSPQVGKLNAQALESKQMWKEAIEAYRNILAQDPKVPGIHFRIASILLDTSPTAESAAEAKKELEAELEINPKSAAAVFVLGEIARRAGAWDEAIQHLHARLAAGCRLPRGIPRARHDTQRSRQIFGCHRAIGALCQERTGRSRRDIISLPSRTRAPATRRLRIAN